MKSLKLAWLAAQYVDTLNQPFRSHSFVTLQSPAQVDFFFQTYTTVRKDAEKGTANIETFKAASDAAGFDGASARHMRRELEYVNKKAQILLAL